MCWTMSESNSLDKKIKIGLYVIVLYMLMSLIKQKPQEIVGCFYVVLNTMLNR